MSGWEQGIKLVLDYEGRAYENDLKDPGGETKFGICKRSYPSIDIAGLTEDIAKALYKHDYWEPILGDQLPDKLAVVVFDCAVNQGLGRAIRLLQVVLNVEADGHVGPRTLAAAHAAGDQAVWLYLLHRAKLYMVTHNIDVYGANWGLRLIKLAQALFPQGGMT